ncbi:MAG: glutaredoxin family protein [Arenicella sp.]
MLLKFFRNAIGALIVFISWLTRPKAVNRSIQEQAVAQQSMEGLSLYQLFACPFCVKTRRALHRLNVNVNIKDIGKYQQFRGELEQGGGKVQVPCLRIEEAGNVRWLYESSDIVQFLEQRVSA